MRNKRFLTLVFCLFFWMSGLNAVVAEDVTVPSPAEADANNKVVALEAILDIKASLNESLKGYREKLKDAVSETEKTNLLAKIAATEKELSEAERNFEEIATDIDLSAIKDQPESAFSLEEEFISLVKPTLQEMSYLTRDVRKKSELREKIAKNQEKQQYIKEALAHLALLLSHAENNKALKSALTKQVDFWKKEEALTSSQLTSALQQLSKTTASEVSITESVQNYFREFFQQRGLYIALALLAMVSIFLASHLFRVLLERTVPQFNQQRTRRSFRVRLLDLTQRILTTVLIVISPVIVFFLAEDWVLFSFSLLVLIGIAWSLKSVVPKYWAQIQLFLNIGSVREGERIFLDGLPWRVVSINVFSKLENPVAGLKQRLPLKDLVDLKSRACSNDEPWFPCAKGDWVILSDGVRGKVIGISVEMVKLVQRGGAHKTYLTPEFLALSPTNLAANFRLKETIGISYDLQFESTREIPQILHQAIEKRIQEEGYGNDLLNLRVEFAYANTSSLDLVVIADFKGHLGDLYGRLSRAIQRWCVDACTENRWEIPFTQITVHGEKVASA